ncbi:MAG TPA: hypothetical protein VE476_08630, partial [Propionibacteriaceae bacterium]|nr:hypothetical protein [Propionibacteriaceae bacterium]
ERRVLDRMEGAIAAVGPAEPGAAQAALLVGFDYVTSHQFARLLAEPDPGGGADPVETLLVRLEENPRGRLLAAAWRAALAAAAGGTARSLCRSALADIARPR